MGVARARGAARATGEEQAVGPPSFGKRDFESWKVYYYYCIRQTHLAHVTLAYQATSQWKRSAYRLPVHTRQLIPPLVEKLIPPALHAAPAAPYQPLARARALAMALAR